MLNPFVHGTACALIAIVYAVVLPSESTPLNKWYDLLTWLERKAPWLAKPLGACEKCFAGQLAIWTSLYFSGWSIARSVAFSHLTCAATAIVVAHFINKAWQRP